MCSALLGGTPAQSKQYLQQLRHYHTTVFFVFFGKIDNNNKKKQWCDNVIT